MKITLTIEAESLDDAADVLLAVAERKKRIAAPPAKLVDVPNAPSILGNVFTNARTVRKLIEVILEQDPTRKNFADVLSKCREIRAAGTPTVLDPISDDDLEARVIAACEAVWGGR
jgi:hypothetical protein